jgi:hypothetical protein
MKIRSAVLAVALSLLPQSFAQEPTVADETIWERERDTMHLADRGEGDKQKALAFAVMTTNTEGVRLKFSCQVTEDGLYSLASGFEVDPVKAQAAEAKRNVHSQKRTIQLNIAGKPSPEPALYNAHTTRLMPVNKSVAKSLFNAVVLGQPISFKMQGKGFTVANPGVDPVFDNFAQKCPVSNGGKVSPEFLNFNR